MQCRTPILVAGVCLVYLITPKISHAQQPDWLKDVAARLPTFTVRAEPITTQGVVSPDGKWLAVNKIVDPGISEPGSTGTERFGIQVLSRDGIVVQNVTHGNPDFYSVTRFVWGKNSNFLYFECGAHMRPGSRDLEDGPLVWKADLNTHTKPPACTKTSFIQMPIWSPHGDSYLITKSKDHDLLESRRYPKQENVFLVNRKLKTRLVFKDAVLPDWSPDGRWIRLVNRPRASTRHNPYLRIADSRSGKDKALTGTLSVVAENRRYGWASATLNTTDSCWLADSKNLLVGVSARMIGGAARTGCFVISLKDGSRKFIPNVYPLSGARDGRTILIERPEKKLFLLHILPKRVNRK